MTTYAIVILQHWTLENKESRLPSTEVFSTLGQVPLFVADLHHRLVGLPNDVGGKEGDDLVIVLDRQVY